MTPTRTALTRLLTRPAGKVSVPRLIGAVALGGSLVFAGVSHLTVARQEFQAQVPPWFPMDKDFVVLASGVVEISLGAALIALRKRRVPVGLLAGAFFILIFPGNISQYVTRTDGFGLNTDRARLLRLFFQPVLVAWALWSTGAWKEMRAALTEARRTD
ncbi:DoxX family protein [Pseudarthrobacter sp. TAF60_1]|uniref:DoxX family protein n=1 Tax=Pseudarthrobacter sp. TAF60_1 TaxID=3233071 RepID=UPI003F9DC595